MCSVHVSEDEQQFLLIGGNADGLLGGTRVAQYDPARGDFEKWDSLYTERWDLTAPRVSLALRDAVKNVLADFFLNGIGGYPPP